MRNFLKTGFILLAVPVLGLSLIAEAWSSGCLQDKERPSDSDWVTSMPVSMNGKLPDNFLWINGLETHRWHDSMRTDHAFQREDDSKPEFFFDDPLVVDLCKAISRADVTEMKQLINKGADFKKIGKDGMTPLYWAFHVKRDPGPFEYLINLGADPNVIVNFTLEKGSPLATLSGNAVTHLVTRRFYNRQFKNVFEHGGDPNLMNQSVLWKVPAFWELWADAPDAVERLQLMIEKGVDLDHRDSEFNLTFVMKNIGKHEEFNRVVLVALKAGASYQFYYKQNYFKQRKRDPDKFIPFEGCYFRLIHRLAEEESEVNERPNKEQIHFRAVVAWLEEHGESLAEAKADLKRWEEWNRSGQSELIEKEHQERLAKETTKKRKG